MTYEDALKLYSKPQITRKEAETMLGLHTRKLGKIRETVLQRSKVLPFNTNYLPLNETCELLGINTYEQAEIIRIVKELKIHKNRK